MGQAEFSEPFASYYGMINVAYFLFFLYRYQNGHVLLGPRASIIVVILFMVVQPLCRIVGGANGIAMYGCSCLSSYVLFPSLNDDRLRNMHNQEEDQKRKIKETAKKNAEKRKRKEK